MDVLKNETSYPYSLDDFATFLDQTYCLENLEFWLAVQRYKFYADSFYNSSNNSSSELFDYDIPSSLPLTSDATINNYLESVVALRGDAPAHLNFLKQKLHELITTYILPNSSKEINIIASSREDLLTNVFQYNNYHPSILETISHQVYELMQGSSFSQFLIEAGNVELRMSSEESQDDSDNSSPIISRRKKSNPVATQEDKEDEDAKKMNKIVGERWERIKNFTHRSNKRSSPSSSNNNGAVDDEKKDENSQSPPLKKFKTDLIPSASWFAYTSPQPNDHSDNNNVIINNSSSSYKPKVFRINGKYVLKDRAYYNKLKQKRKEMKHHQKTINFINSHLPEAYWIKSDDNNNNNQINIL
ncbi:5098_t:CDS:2 [Entrophospora sp. SA101]|nr:5098_t:CDS:2 [Entrophospora sp. SA101]